MATMSIGAAVLAVALVWTNRKNLASFRSSALAWAYHPQIKKYLFASLGLFLACLLSLVVARLFPYKIGDQSIEVHILKEMGKGWYFIWPIVLAAALAQLTLEDRRFVLRVWFSFFLFLGVLSVVQYYWGWPRMQQIPYLSPARFHVTLFLGHHLSVASILIFPFFWAVDELSKKSKIFTSPHIWWPIFGFGLWALIGTYSRTLWIALPVGLLVFVFWKLSGKWRWWLGSGIVAMAALLSQVPALQERMKNPMGVSDRTLLWEANFAFFRDRPWTGLGWHYNEAYSSLYLTQKYPKAAYLFFGHAHNNFIDMLGGTGAIGALAWLIWWGVVLALIWRVRDRFLGILCAFLVFHINGLTQVNMWEAKVQHQVAWILGWVFFAIYTQKEGAKTGAAHPKSIAKDIY